MNPCDSSVNKKMKGNPLVKFQDKLCVPNLRWSFAAFLVKADYSRAAIRLPDASNFYHSGI